MRIANIQDTLLKADLVQRLHESLLSQARVVQSEAEPKSMERTRIYQERLEEPEDTRETNIREEEKGRREPYLSRRRHREDKDEKPGEEDTPSDGHIIDITA